MPIGQSGYDAFGNQPVFVDEGDRLRAIANIGREDVIIEGLTPIASGIRVLGGSSDHLMLDVTDADPPVKVGDRVSFRMNYGAMLTAMTSEYVEKAPLHDVDDLPDRRRVSISRRSGLGAGAGAPHGRRAARKHRLRRRSNWATWSARRPGSSGSPAAATGARR